MVSPQAKSEGESLSELAGTSEESERINKNYNFL